MAIKPADLLNQLPSVSELLEKPPIRALASRWNRSVVAGSVRSFLDELRGELRRRAGEMPVPSVRELAERAARFVVSQQQISLGTAINATGRLWSESWSSQPLADAALERLVAVGREFVLEKPPASGGPPIDPEPLLCRLTGAAASAVAHSYAGALWLALTALADGREVLVARAEVGEIELAEPLPKLAAASNIVLREVGTINRATAADYEASASPQAAAVLKVSSDAYRVVGETSMAHLDELVAVSRASELFLIDALGAAALDEPPIAIGWPLRSARASLAAGADLTLVRGDGLVGGPTCGILLGSREIIRRITDQPMFPALRLGVLGRAALVATLECYESKCPAEDIPLWQILGVSVENLRNRAERLAPQLAEAEGIGSAAAVETRSPLFSMLAEGWPSYGIALNAANDDIQSLDRQLRNAPLPALGRIEGDRLMLDLRTVVPRQDKMLVEALLGTPTLKEHAMPQGEAQP
jgi:L-seryl-tRNA(Ser) seleniumtransferase